MHKNTKAQQRAKIALSEADDMIKELQSKNACLQFQLDGALKRVEATLVRLQEARRRTLPIANGEYEINFLPLGVLEYTTESQMHEINWGHNRVPFMARGSQRFIVKVLAEMVENPPVIHQVKSK